MVNSLLVWAVLLGSLVPGSTQGRPLRSRSTAPKRFLDATSKQTASDATEPITVVSLIEGEANLSKLDIAITAAGLVDTLSIPAFPYTFFAPTNEAFEAADKGGFVTKLLSPAWKAHLRAFVKAHISRGKFAILASNLTDNMAISTFGTFYVPGETVKATVSENGVASLSGLSFNESTIIESDLVADNGVVHKVDKVFMPATLTRNIFETANAMNGYIDTIVTLITMADFEDTLRHDIVTIFCPSNAAFESLSSKHTGELWADPDRIKHIISNHIVDGVWAKDRLDNGLVLTTRADEQMTFSVGSGYFADHSVNGAVLEVTDVIGSNGIVHIVDAVLFPTGESDSEAPLPSEETPPCSLCKADEQVARPETIVQVPDGLVEGVTEATCSSADAALQNNPAEFPPEMCVQVREIFKNDCGCVPRDPSVGYDCSVCGSGKTISKPDAVVDLPEGVLQGFSRATCSLMNAAVVENPSLFTEQKCLDLRDLYEGDCGCISVEDVTATEAPASQPAAPVPVPLPVPPTTENTDDYSYCSICEPGKEIRKPDKVIVIPAGFIVDDVSFATCALLERGLVANPGAVDKNLCDSLRGFYSDPCRCRRIKVEEQPQPSPTAAPTKEKSYARILLSPSRAVVVVSGAIVALSLL